MLCFWLACCCVATTPSLRDTSPQGEAFVWLPLRGAGGVAVCGVALFSILSYLLFAFHRATDDRPYKHKVLRTERRPRRPFFVPYPNATRISVGATIGRPITLTLRGAGNAVDCGVVLFSILSYLLFAFHRATDDRPYKHKVLRTERRPRRPFFVPYPNATRISVGATNNRPYER